MKYILLMSTLLVTMNSYAQTKEKDKKEESQATKNFTACLGGGDLTMGSAVGAKEEECVGVVLAAVIGGHSGATFEKDSVSPKDKSFECKKNSQITLDWDACAASVKRYNTMVGLDTAMQMSSNVQSQLANTRIQKEVNQKAADGNLQTAALEATAEKNKADAGILQQQMLFYGTQAAALETQINVWPTKRKTVCNSRYFTKDKQQAVTKILTNMMTTYVSKVPNTAGKIDAKGVTVATFTNKGSVSVTPVNEATCNQILSQFSDSQLFPNGNARSVLVAKALEAMGKAAAAGINANGLRKNAQIADNLADQYVDDSGAALFELCTIDPANAKCKTSGTRVNQSNYTAGQLDLGGAGAGQAFNLNPNSGTADEIGNIGTPEANKVAGINSPFGEDAKEAAGLLDEAGGASYTSAGAGGGGSGGVGGGGGGGSASLGSDLQGADNENKEAEIKASKRDGGYGSASGSGFTAMGGNSDEENPLKSLFDQDGAKGGIEEDRSVASEDIDNSNSALFERISKRYAKVHGEKRIEANNLE